MLDLIINHTSDEHIWAERAKKGEPRYEAMYGIYPDRTIPDLYERNLREIFPDEHPGAFTWFEQLKKMGLDDLPFIPMGPGLCQPGCFQSHGRGDAFPGKPGIEIFRLDAVAFIWKELGTSCENLPEAHIILQGYNALTRIAAPSMLFKSEAIVHPTKWHGTYLLRNVSFLTIRS